MAKVIIIGGGPAGCEAAHQLASQGIDVELVEKNNETGGNLNNWSQLFPDRNRQGSERHIKTKPESPEDSVTSRHGTPENREEQRG